MTLNRSTTLRQKKEYLQSNDYNDNIYWNLDRFTVDPADLDSIQPPAADPAPAAEPTSPIKILNTPTPPIVYATRLQAPASVQVQIKQRSSISSSTTTQNVHLHHHHQHVMNIVNVFEAPKKIIKQQSPSPIEPPPPPPPLQPPALPPPAVVVVSPPPPVVIIQNPAPPVTPPAVNQTTNTTNVVNHHHHHYYGPPPGAVVLPSATAVPVSAKSEATNVVAEVPPAKLEETTKPKVLMMALEDAWVTKEVYEQEMARRKQQAELDVFAAQQEKERKEFEIQERRRNELIMQDLKNLELQVSLEKEKQKRILAETHLMAQRERIGALQRQAALVDTVNANSSIIQGTQIQHGNVSGGGGVKPAHLDSHQNLALKSASAGAPLNTITAASDATLNSSADDLETSSKPIDPADILGERRRPRQPSNRSDKFKPSELISRFTSGPEDKKHVVASETSDWGRLALKAFRYANLMRAIATTLYSLTATTKQLQNPYYQTLGADGVMIAMIFFSLVDLIIAFFKAFQKNLWFCWNVRDWDPYTKIFSIWALVADHDLILDASPILVNMILKIYSYRISEVSQNPNAMDSILSSNMTLADLSTPAYHNYIQLMLFGASLLFTICFHTGRMVKVLAVDKKAIALAVVILIKSLLLIWDVFTNSLLLYESLVADGTLLCTAPSTVTKMLLSVVVASPFVTLATNVLMNVPLHAFFLRMQLVNAKTKEVSWWRIIKAAWRKAFHPLIMATLGSYAIYSLCVLFYSAAKLSRFNPMADLKHGQIPEGAFPTSGFFGWTSSSDPTTAQGPLILLGMVWLNLVANYLIGAVVSIVYWLGVVLFNVLGGERGVKWLRTRLQAKK